MTITEAYPGGDYCNLRASETWATIQADPTLLKQYQLLFDAKTSASYKVLCHDNLSISLPPRGTRPTA